MLKILTILGTRPEIIRLSRIISKLDKVSEHRILHTGQNYDNNLNEIFFRDLGLRNPDYILENKNYSLGHQLANTFIGVENCLTEFKPDKVLVLGDTNSGLSAIICERLGIPVYHMEAGNRCYDLKVPEEKNRRIIDAVSTVNLPYTNLSRENLLREGITNSKILVTGNPIKEVLTHYNQQIQSSTIIEKLDLVGKKFVVATAHRAENVDDSQRLQNIFDALENISCKIPVVFSCHPRTKEKLKKINFINKNNNFKICEPMGFFDFVKLEKNASIAITDSGTVQEEMCLFKIPTITIRDTTERPETVWCGSNIVCGTTKDRILEAFTALYENSTSWDIPQGYEKLNVSDTVINILLSN